jgi:hypothetical protein
MLFRFGAGVDPAFAPPGGLSRVIPLDADLSLYANAWHAAVAAQELPR